MIASSKEEIFCQKLAEILSRFEDHRNFMHFHANVTTFHANKVSNLKSRPSPFRDRFMHEHINGRVYGKIRRGKERAWDTSPESWVMYSDVIVFVVSLWAPPRMLYQQN